MSPGHGITRRAMVGAGHGITRRAMVGAGHGITRRAMVGAGAALMALGAAPAPVQAASDLQLRRGVNAWPWFSLTREYPAPRRDYAWPPLQEQRPVPRPADLDRLRQAGFDFLRLPVDPGPFLAFSGAERERLLQSLWSAIDRIRAAGLKVVVNLQTNDATHYWNAQRLLASFDAPDFPAYRDLVATVARRLAAYPADAVALEPVNEPPQGCGSALWSQVQMALLSAARAEAPDLTLIATGSCGSMIRGLAALDPGDILTLGPVLFTFHYYEPYLFSHQGAPWMREPVYRDLNAVPWPASAGSLEGTLAAVRRRMAADPGRGEAEKRAAYAVTERLMAEYFAAEPARPFIEKAFAGLRDWRDRHGIAADRILLGEFGALRSDAQHVAASAADRARYVADVRLTAEAFGHPWAFWNLFDSMGLMDDATRALDPSIIAALGLQMPAS